MTQSPSITTFLCRRGIVAGFLREVHDVRHASRRWHPYSAWLSPASTRIGLSCPSRTAPSPDCIYERVEKIRSLSTGSMRCSCQATVPTVPAASLLPEALGQALGDLFASKDASFGTLYAPAQPKANFSLLK